MVWSSGGPGPGANDASESGFICVSRNFPGAGGLVAERATARPRPLFGSTHRVTPVLGSVTVSFPGRFDRWNVRHGRRSRHVWRILVGWQTRRSPVARSGTGAGDGTVGGR